MKTFVCLLIAAVTGSALQYAGVPHGLLLGSIVATAIVVSKFNVAPQLRLGMGYVQIVLGIATGLMFEAWDNQTVATMLPSIGLLLLCLATQITVAAVWLQKASAWNRKDSLLAVYPGALAAVFDLLESERASSKVIVVHLVRLLSITLLVSLCIPANAGAPVSASSPWTIVTALTLLSLIMLCIVLGRLLLKFGVPAPFMLTAIIATGVYVKLGLLHAFHMPQWSVDGAALLLGVMIGARFRQISPAELVRHGRAGLMSVGLMLLVAAAFAGIAARVLNNDPLTLWLAYMPGAIETIAIVAFSGGLNVVFVLTHHLLRMVVLHFAPALLVQARRWRENV
ncbi:AbrB family transcriptional regulator [Pseudomonas rubra]|uniref:AbrB family transcriptional regulator n=1 Tax=Pseudomonas rubra TaxID=2942627 RepID=A0ABT5P3Y6_9PSED|nr:AbrB family transcriptional regulator [Pseudomonas rubra]MDD1012877.1 AbrB family transcriptional regulator [Pseudomonas rubra]MDD1038255.1 AbrB family transcriptional regulator [Pseudomonas rubra]MDD1156666.1 AbrB family transcriptional regulator [Pseudomonas rubra]